MKLYNTLTKKVEEFKPLDGKKVSFFVCGPTVYDHSHLGHAKTYIQMDTLARVLRNSGYDLTFILNITDIDDKIIARSAEIGVAWDKLSREFENEFYKDMKALGIESVDQYARATDYVEQIISQVQRLIDKGHAYSIDGDGIYFEISTFPEYGKLSGRQEIKENDAQSRIDQSDKKRGWNDFCIWKFSKPGEPIWDAPFGDGRPGWHIEDTAITEHFFGPQYDIHGGAVDLVFPHHEAELTQMESLSGKVPFVKYWTHVGFMNIDNAKMSKSLGNFLTIREVIEKGYDPIAIRLLMLQPHYRSEVNFSWENLDAAQNRLNDLRAWADLRHQPSADSMPEELDLEFKAMREGMVIALSDDLNSPQALSCLNKLVNYMSKIPIPSVEGKHTQGTLGLIDALLGLNLDNRPDITPEQKTLISEREKARNAKEWAKSDEIRDHLASENISIRDTDHGPVWSRI